MTHNITCPGCLMTVATPAAGGTHHSSDGPVQYLRCVCGRWLVVLAGEPIAATTRSSFTEQAAVPALR